MTRIDYRLFAALALSLSLHLLPLLPDFDFGQKSPSTLGPAVASMVVATLKAEPRSPPPAPAPPLSLPEQPQPAAAKPRPTPTGKAASAAPATKTWTQAVREHLRKLDAAGQFYPADAIARGEQGEVLVLLILDEQGAVSAARVEQGSAYPSLDAAALRAVRSLRTLPADAPRQVVLPVRFILR